MAPPSKYTVEQQQFIKLWMPEFLIKKAGKNLDNFWPRMKAQYLSEWPEELELGLPLQQVSADSNAAPMVKLTKEEQARLDATLEARFNQLRNSFFNAFKKIREQRGGVSKSSSSLASILFKARPKGRRRHQVLEVYQKAYQPTVKAALKASEYDVLNEASQCRDEDGEWVDDDDDSAKMKRLKEAQSKQMSTWRRVVQAAWDAELQEVKEKVRQMAKTEVVKQTDTVGGADDVERTPEEYQTSIEESLQVTDMFLKEFGRMTGWMGTLIYGGPMPEQKGELVIQTVSFGTTPGPSGLNFAKWHPKWKKGVTNPFFAFLRQAIPTNVRIARGIFTRDDNNNDRQGKESDAEKAPDPAESDAADSDAEGPVKQKKQAKKTKTTPERAPHRADTATEAPARKSKTAQKTNTTPEVVDVTAKPPKPKPRAKTAASKLALVVRSAKPGPAAGAQEAAELADTPSFAPDEVTSLTAPMDFIIPPAGRDNVDLMPFSDLSGASNEASTDPMGFQQYYSPSHNTGGTAYGAPRAFTFSGGGEFDRSNSDYTGDLHFDGFGGDAESSVGGALTAHYHYPASQSVAGVSTQYTFPLTPMQEEMSDFEALRARSAEPSLFSYLVAPAATRPLPRRKSSSSPATTPFEFGRDGRYRLNGPFGPSVSTPVTPTVPTRAAPAATPTPPPPSLTHCSAASSTPRTPAVMATLPTPALARHPPTLTTPNRLSSTPVRSSPLAGPPLHAVARDTTPPPASLPPCLRPSPQRQGSSVGPSASPAAGASTPPSPPVFLQSRPMANQPKAAKVAPSPGTIAKRMEKARSAKKVSVSKAKKKKMVAVGAKAAVAKNSTVGVGATNGSGSAGDRVEEAPEVQAETPPVLIYSVTNNNGRRLQEEAAVNVQNKKAAAARKAENMRHHNPDGDTPLFVTHGRRSIQAPSNRGDVLTLKQRNELLAEKTRQADEKLENEFKKRKAATEENMALTKRVKRG
ncbi:hypothetical protein DFH09DRAFT_1305742 [Mycena vulgaris]|nr:hypothetical protein DFH09DRAFT_1305742 [Mycena vulgaris]